VQQYLVANNNENPESIVSETRKQAQRGGKNNQFYSKVPADYATTITSKTTVAQFERYICVSLYIY
jgi:hypothetical protein